MSMLLPVNPKAVEESVRAVIEKTILEEGERQIEIYLEDLRIKLRKKVIDVALTIVQSSYSLQSDGRILTIQVHLAEPRK